MLRVLSTLRHRRAARGFTLVEMAIVLGIASIVFGALWSVISMVTTKANVHATAQQVLMVAQNVREQYMGAATPATWANATNPAVSNDITLILDAVRIFPPEMRQDSTLAAGDAGQLINHALVRGGGTLQVISIVGTDAALVPAAANPVCTNIPCFRIVATNLDVDACIALANRLPIADRTMGIVQVGLLNTACTAATPCVSTTAVSVATASASCEANPRANTLVWDFRLHN